jgi:hypothetical protein
MEAKLVELQHVDVDVARSPGGALKPTEFGAEVRERQWGEHTAQFPLHGP